MTTTRSKPPPRSLCTGFAAPLAPWQLLRRPPPSGDLVRTTSPSSARRHECPIRRWNQAPSRSVARRPRSGTCAGVSARRNHLRSTSAPSCPSSSAIDGASDAAWLLGQPSTSSPVRTPFGPVLLSDSITIHLRKVFGPRQSSATLAPPLQEGLGTGATAGRTTSTAAVSPRTRYGASNPRRRPRCLNSGSLATPQRRRIHRQRQLPRFGSARGSVSRCLANRGETS